MRYEPKTTVTDRKHLLQIQQELFPGPDAEIARNVLIDLHNCETNLAEATVREPISDMPTGAHMILDERRRQIEKEGWTSEHDDVHKLGELSQAAHAYAGIASAQARGASSEEFPADMMVAEGDWPFEECWWKPSADPIRNLVKAGALIAAEIDRLQRLGKQV